MVSIRQQFCLSPGTAWSESATGAAHLADGSTRNEYAVAANSGLNDLGGVMYWQKHAVALLRVGQDAGR